MTIASFLPFLLALPVLLAFNLSPSATLLNQLLAFAGWGLLLMLAAPTAGRPGSAVVRGVWPLWGVGAALAVAILWSCRTGLPPSLAWSALAALGAAAVLVAWGQQRPEGLSIGAGLLLAGALSAVIAVVQVFLPEGADGLLIARSGLAGRAVGNLRQPNHLSTVLLWGLIWLVPLAQRGGLPGWRWSAWAWQGLGALMVLGVVLTASRTGMVGIGLLALWGMLDRRLARPIRWSLGLAPLAYLVFFLLLALWAHQTQHTFGGEARLAEADLSASRWGIWSNTLSLIRDQPWTGVGFGEFNFAWTLTPFPGRPVAFFDHTHNLPLQLAVELGLPAAAVLMGLLLLALWQAGRRAWARRGEDGAGARAAFMTVLLIGLHSLLEYPLWYAYFLLPTAWAWGHALRQPDAIAETPTAMAATASSRRGVASALPGGGMAPRALGTLMLAGALFAAWDYSKVVVIYAPGDSPLSLAERIARGQESVFFAHHADYAAATTTEPPSRALAAFNVTAHSLLDTRLMMAWGRALAESGHGDQARYLAARLKEFRNPAATEFFAVCDAPQAASAPAFQCARPTAPLTWRDFRPH